MNNKNILSDKLLRNLSYGLPLDNRKTCTKAD